MTSLTPLLLAALLSQPSRIEALAQTDAYGGSLAIGAEATGWFRVEELTNAAGQRRWMFVTPEGHGYVALGANHVGRYLDEQAAEYGLLARLGTSRDGAADWLIGQMRDLGLNAGEAYAPIMPEITERLPWVANVRFPGPSKFAFDPFDSAFRRRLDESIRMQCAAFADNRLVLGIAFPDLPVWDERRLAYFDGLPADAPGAIERQRFRDAGRTDDAFLAHVADTLYRQIRESTRTAAPNHLLFGERFRLRGTPDEVIAAVGPHIDVFCTQALILSPQRPPEWQLFQPPRYIEEHRLAGKPMVVIDWAAPFSLGETLETQRGAIRNERAAADEAAEWLVAAVSQPYVVGVFKCQLIGTHANDRWFDGRARRTYLQDDGQPFAYRTERTRQAHREALEIAYGLTTPAK